MLRKLAKLLVLSGLSGLLLSGLCASAQTNTTAPNTADSNVHAPASIAIDNVMPVPGVSPIVKTRPFVRMALLLPLDSDTLAAAAESVRAGFFAAYERDNSDVTVTIFKTGARPQDLLPAYAEAASQADIVIGPLSRDDVATIAQNEKISTPTIALSQLDASDDDEVIFPQKMLMMGLSAEAEARQAAAWAGAAKKAGQAFIVSTDTPWQRRAAKAFAKVWQQRGSTQQRIEIASVDGYLGASSVAQLKARIQAEKPALIFMALDAAQALQVRMVLGNDTPIYGTSQLNALTLSDWQNGASLPQMDGVRLLDIPWQLQPDHLAVMSYPHAAIKENQKPSADLERLYALGIDAYRVAKEIAAHQSDFTIDGVTGALTIGFGAGAPSFQRVALPAIYRHGSLVPLNDAK